MGWATDAIARLQRGETVTLRPRGSSMEPHVRSGQLVTVVPLDAMPAKRDIVLRRVNGRQYLHFVLAVQGDRVQIGNARGHVNGWTHRSSIYGKVVAL